LSSNRIKCPSCNLSDLDLTQSTISVPHFGETIILSFKCAKCGFISSDVIAADDRPPKKYIFEFKKVEHLNVRVVKSSKATIKIPELDFISDPGPQAKGFIGNVETIINQIESTIGYLRNWTTEKSKIAKLDDIEKKLEKIREGDFCFKLIISDKTGNSAILPDPPDEVQILDIN